MKTLKTAISIDKGLFEKVQSLCEKIKLSRSQFFSQAVEYFITKSENLEIIQRINNAYADLDSRKDEKLLKLRKAKYKNAIVDKW